MSEVQFDGQQELKEKSKRLVVEIGASHDTSYLNQYKVELPPGTAYQIIHADYAILPNEEDNRRAIPLEDSTVDEVVISNVLSDNYFSPVGDDARNRKYWDYYVSKNGPIEKIDFDESQDDIATFQKIRTIKDIIRVLKTGGILRIYENYNQLRPNAVANVLKWLEDNQAVNFSEDEDEEKRVQPILDEENKEKFVISKEITHPAIFDPKEVFYPRPYNKVYKIVKK